MMVRLVPLLGALALLGCSSEPEAPEDDLVTLDPSSSADAVEELPPAEASIGGGAPPAGQAVIEPLTTAEREAAGIVGGHCSFRRQEGSVPVFSVATDGGTALIRLTGTVRRLSGGMAARGGSYSGEGVTASITGVATAGGLDDATLTVTGSAGDATITDGVYRCE